MQTTKMKYENPPILEAICEINFSDTQNWDWTFPGLFFNEIKDKYPEKKEIRGIGLEFSFRKNIDPTVNKLSESVDKIQFWSNDKTKVVQIGENKLIINQRTPYRGWKFFNADINKLLQIYNEITDQDLVKNISLRYINKINQLPLKFEFDNYFLIYPNFPSNLSMATGPLNVQGHFKVDSELEANATIKISFYNQKVENNINWFLDIHTNLSLDDESINIDDIHIYLKEGHDNIIETFESCITDNLRELFGVVN